MKKVKLELLVQARSQAGAWERGQILLVPKLRLGTQAALKALLLVKQSGYVMKKVKPELLGQAHSQAGAWEREKAVAWEREVLAAGNEMDTENRGCGKYENSL